MGNLAGLHIVVTRPSAQAEPWAARLRELGASTSVASLLEIVPVSDAVHIQAIKNCILDLDLYRKAIFVSQNAVEHGFDWIDRYWPQLPVGIDFFAVGETTAKKMHALGAKVTDLAQSQTGAMTSETLLQSPALQAVAGEKIIIFRGRGGRPHIGEVLSARGAKVDYCELYERILPADAIKKFAAILSQPERDAAVSAQLVLVLHSGEALENVQKILRELPLDERAIMARVYVLVPSLRIQALAQAAGFKHVWAAQNATDVSMLQGLIELAASC